MKSFELEIQKLAQKTRLKAIEREAIRDRILSYMEYHPLKKEKLSLNLGNSSTGTESGRNFIYIPFNSIWVKLGSATLALILVIGVPLLAERAVPGDMLYLVKTGVNEGIRGQLASSPYEKVQLETRLIERRIAEARLLASEGKLTHEVETQIAETVKGHADAVQSGLAELRVDDVDGAAIAEIVFNSALEVQSAVLDQSEETGSSSVASILDAVNTAREVSLTDENTTAPSYDGLSARVESETTRAYELFKSVQESATVEEIGDIERRLEDIDRSIVVAKELKESDETKAVALMIDVLGQIQKLITFMTDIDLREMVTLESLVPVVLTKAERTETVLKALTEMDKDMSDIEKKIPLITDDNVGEKVTFGIKETNKIIVITNEKLTDGDISGSEKTSLEARALVDDLLSLTKDIQIIEEGAILPGTSTTTASTTIDGTLGTSTATTTATTTLTEASTTTAE